MTRAWPAFADHIYRTQPSVLARALGLILSGALILGWAAMRILDTIEGV